jgi:hypothetical protein
MGRVAKPLTIAQVWKLPRGLHAVGGGLIVHVGATDRHWKLRRYLNGKQRMWDVGSLQELPTLEAAQAAAAERLAVVLNGRAAKPRKVAPAVLADNPFLGPIARELLATSS